MAFLWQDTEHQGMSKATGLWGSVLALFLVVIIIIFFLHSLVSQVKDSRTFRRQHHVAVSKGWTHLIHSTLQV